MMAQKGRKAAKKVKTGKKKCSHEGCDKPLLARSLCRSHYDQAKSTNSLPTKICKEEGCGEIKFSGGLCAKHFWAGRKPKKTPKPRPSPSTEKKRKRINPVSSKRKAWNDKYYAQVEKDAPYQSPVDQPDKLYGKDNHYKIQRHHPYRRTNDLILCFCYISSEFHAWLENHATEARRMGWIKDGPPEPGDIRPWPESCEINHQWPRHHRRTHEGGIE